MKRLSLYGFVGLLAGVLAGCPIYNGNGGVTEPSGVGGSSCVGQQCGTGTGGGAGGGSPIGCQSSADCPANETCGADNECHTGDCTFSGCSPGYTCVIGANQEATCQPSGSGGGGGASSTTSTGSSQGGAGGGSTTTTTGSGGQGGAGSSTTTGSGGAGGQPVATPCTGADGTQGTCATGSICLDLHCYISCVSNNQCAAAGDGLPICEAVPDGANTYNICGSATPGSQCGALAPDGGAPCAAPTLCIDGTCQ
jgi:hypothetical protein